MGVAYGLVGESKQLPRNTGKKQLVVQMVSKEGAWYSAKIV